MDSKLSLNGLPKPVEKWVSYEIIDQRFCNLSSFPWLFPSLFVPQSSKKCHHDSGNYHWPSCEGRQEKILPLCHNFWCCCRCLHAINIQVVQIFTIVSQLSNFREDQCWLLFCSVFMYMNLSETLTASGLDSSHLSNISSNLSEREILISL